MRGSTNYPPFRRDDSGVVQAALLVWITDHVGPEAAISALQYALSESERVRAAKETW